MFDLRDGLPHQVLHGQHVCCMVVVVQMRKDPALLVLLKDLVRQLLHGCALGTVSHFLPASGEQPRQASTFSQEHGLASAPWHDHVCSLR